MPPWTSSSTINPISLVTHLSSGPWTNLRYYTPSSKMYLRLCLCILLVIGGNSGKVPVLNKSKTARYHGSSESPLLSDVLFFSTSFVRKASSSTHSTTVASRSVSYPAVESWYKMFASCFLSLGTWSI
ncbi:hypothetical protein LIER_36609 [Lithospermum erythrorhizon]|uniref:Uncharacterized protein n=1 Tax=Lithospermum erythrorhizon TaxID=34254 RepID=A0AAV3P8H8_LITER